MIYHEDDAERFKSRAGEKYRPSNGTDGGIFQAAYCDRCIHYVDASCDILTLSFFCDIDDDDYPTEWQYGETEWQYGEDGQPKCTAFELEDKADGS